MRQLCMYTVHGALTLGCYRTLAYDFALFFLEEDFELGKHIDTVCLPDLNENFDGDRCWVTGWGRDKFGTD